MIIPHVAIVSSLLLGGNNPSVWEASSSFEKLDGHSKGPRSATNEIGKAVTSDAPAKTSLLRPSSLGYIFGFLYCPMYNSRYKPAWLWNRGLSKAKWVAELVKQHPNLDKLHVEALGDGVGLSCGYAWLVALFLVVLPPFLGGMVRSVKNVEALYFPPSLLVCFVKRRLY